MGSGAKKGKGKKGKSAPAAAASGDQKLNHSLDMIDAFSKLKVLRLSSVCPKGTLRSLPVTRVSSLREPAYPPPPQLPPPPQPFLTRGTRMAVRKPRHCPGSRISASPEAHTLLRCRPCVGEHADHLR